MLQFVWNKIKNKKWLNLCLLIGISLLTALFVCHPMFEKGANNEVLKKLFLTYAQEQKEFPATLERNGTFDKKDYSTAKSVCQQLDAYENKWTEYVDLDVIASQQHLRLSGNNADTSLGGKNYNLAVGLLPEMDKYTKVVQGEALKKAVCEQGIFPCVISESTMDAYGLVVGEQLNFTSMSMDNQEPLCFQIVGIIKETDIHNNYWNHTLSDFEKEILVSEETFDTLISKYNQDTIAYQESLMLNYTQITSDNANTYASYLRQFQKADGFFSENILDTLHTFSIEKQTIRRMLWALEIPCIVLLLLFIYMVSTQILTSEEGEITVLRRRGTTRMQTLSIYLLQSGILSFLGMGIGILAGYGMCKMAASTDAFLTFTSKDISMYEFTWQMIPFGLLACIISILFMTIPVWKRTKGTIATPKTLYYSAMPIPFWERYFLDMILLIISGYLLYNFNKQKDTLTLSMIALKSIDPMMLLNTSLFIFACGLLFLRLSRYFVLLINHLGQKYWSPALYASFLQLKRTWHKQGFLAIFLIMTISSGIFDANMARTMNRNMEERIRYNIGTDLKLTGNWKLQVIHDTDDSVKWEYLEPDYGVYTSLKTDGLCSSMTRVIQDNNTEINANNKTVTQAQLMAIQTKEFGETAQLMNGLNDTHWFYALNALAKEPEGVIISENLAKKLNLKVGDTLMYSRYHPITSLATEKMGSVSGKVCAIVSCFPGYEQYIYEKNEEGEIAAQENYLLVGNYATVISEFQMTPYQVWMRLAKGTSTKDVTNFLQKNAIEYTDLQSTPQQITENRNSAMVQVTNGMFTLSFIISLVICSVGFLIYWIMSIKNRELLFGIYRAMGMRMREINTMLITEQIFSSLLAILAGGAVGTVSTFLFVPLTTLIYLPQKHNISIQIFVHSGDIVKLAGVIFVVILLLFIVLRSLLKNMKIAQALRLGED